jgi:hypothetical protein
MGLVTFNVQVKIDCVDVSIGSVRFHLNFLDLEKPP